MLFEWPLIDAAAGLSTLHLCKVFITLAVAEEGWRSPSELLVQALTENRVPVGPVYGEEFYGQCFRTVLAFSLDWVPLISICGHNQD